MTAFGVGKQNAQSVWQLEQRGPFCQQQPSSLTGLQVPHTLISSSRLKEWLFSSEKISESSWKVRKLSLFRGNTGKSAMVPHWVPSLRTQMTPAKLTAAAGLADWGYSRVFRWKGEADSTAFVSSLSSDPLALGNARAAMIPFTHLPSTH